MADAAPARILVADDEPTILELLTTVLSLWGFEVETCSTGEAALTRVLEGKYSLLLIDHLMPLLTGLEVLQKLRAQNRRLPCILMSGHFPETIAAESRALGIGLLPKPFAMAGLREALDRALASA